MVPGLCLVGCVGFYPAGIESDDGVSRGDKGHDQIGVLERSLGQPSGGLILEKGN